MTQVTRVGGESQAAVGDRDEMITHTHECWNIVDKCLAFELLLYRCYKDQAFREATAVQSASTASLGLIVNQQLFITSPSV